MTVGGRHTVEERERKFDAFFVDHAEYQGRLQAATGSATVYIDEAGFYSPITESQLHSAAGQIPNLPLIVVQDQDKRTEKWRRFTPTVTLSALANDDLLERFSLDSGMMYFTYSKGFKAGGFEPRGPELVPFDPEDVVNFELGLKLDAVENRLRFNAALYQMDYTNIHVRVAEQGEAISDIFLFLSNAGEAQIRGAELETTIVWDEWLIHTSANYTDAIYDTFEASVVTPGTGETNIVDRSAEDFALVPRKSFSLAVQWNGMTPIGAIIPRLSMYYRSGLFVGIDERAAEFETSFVDELTLWNGRVSWMPGENMRFSLYVNNLTDEEYYKSGFAVSALLGSATLVQGDQRTYGLEFNYEFW